MAKKGEGYNKFLPPFDREKAEKLRDVLLLLQDGIFTVSGLVKSLDDIVKRPSCVRGVDVRLMSTSGLFEAINKI